VRGAKKVWRADDAVEVVRYLIDSYPSQSIYTLRKIDLIKFDLVKLGEDFKPLKLEVQDVNLNWVCESEKKQAGGNRKRSTVKRDGPKKKQAPKGNPIMNHESGEV